VTGKTSANTFESKPVVKIILIYDRLNLWRHRQFITIFYQFLNIRIEIIHGSHMHIGTTVVAQLVNCLSSKCRRRLLFPLWLIHLTTWHLYTGLPEIYLDNFEKKSKIINFHDYWFLIWPSYFNLPIIIDFDDDESSDEESWIQSNMITIWTGTPVVHNVFTYKILFISNNCVLYV
jgi:hypothetical protein